MLVTLWHTLWIVVVVVPEVVGTEKGADSCFWGKSKQDK